MPRAHPLWGVCATNLAGSLRSRYNRGEALDDLDESISLLREVAANRADTMKVAVHGDTALLLGSIGNALNVGTDLGQLLLQRHDRARDARDLDEAILHFGAPPPDDSGPRSDPDDAEYGLAVAHLERFRRTGGLADLDRACVVARNVLAKSPPGHPRRAARLSMVSVLLGQQHACRGAPDLLDESIALSRDAVAEPTPFDDDHWAAVMNLASLLRQRHGRDGALADVDESIDLLRGGAEAPGGEGRDTSRLMNLSVSLRNRYDRTQRPSDLDEAVDACRRALELSAPDHPDRAMALSTIGSALDARFDRDGSRADLDEAIAYLREAVTATGAETEHPARAGRIANLAGALLTRYGAGADGADLDAAIALWRDAVKLTPADRPDATNYLVRLGDALRLRFERTGDAGDISAVRDTHRLAAAVETAPPHSRAVAARNWGAAAAALGDWPDALEGYGAALEHLGRVAPRSLTRADQEHGLAAFDGLATAAVACALEAGDGRRALQWWEQGRGILLGQALDARTDLSELAEAHPELANRFMRIRDALDHDEEETEQVGAGSHQDRGAQQRQVDRRLALVSEFDGTVEEIRTLSGFDRFLLAPAVETLLTAASDGAIVLLNVNDARSDALVIEPSGVQLVRLPGVTSQAVLALVDLFVGATENQDDVAMLAVLTWLWGYIVGPVMQVVAPEPGANRRPRVWWCPAGWLALLPVHAAIDPHVEYASALDRVVSSYTPTIRALEHARRDAAARGSRRMEVVVMERTPGAEDLEHVWDELLLLEDLVEDGIDVLSGPEATRAAVLDALGQVDRVHFACHAISDLVDPSASRLLLHDHQTEPLTVADIGRLRLETGELAFLSACATARAGAKLPDEAIHLASAFQIAGFRQVVATLWPVPDEAALTVAEDFYCGLLDAPRDAAAALHGATCRMRDAAPRQPSLWAAHVHHGI
jgi:tetratricopeptide (TPR) repeat protein